MQRSGVEIRPNFVPLDAQPALTGIARNHQGGVSQRLSESVLMFPSGAGLTRDEVSSICAEIRAWLA
jgi:dTDP-4-amino-4,6-dideoxygalactose transaminase